MRKWFLMAFGTVALCAMMSSAPYNTFADYDDEDLPKVRSAKEKCTGQGENEKCRCKTHNRFKTTHDVYAKLKNFPPDTYVDLYITLNKKWNMGDLIGPDERGSFQVLQTDGDGKVVCEKIWENPDSGKYDIVVDANQDGTYNDGDAIDGRRKNPGFRVK